MFYEPITNLFIRIIKSNISKFRALHKANGHSLLDIPYCLENRKTDFKLSPFLLLPEPVDRSFDQRIHEGHFSLLVITPNKDGSRKFRFLMSIITGSENLR